MYFTFESDDGFRITTGPYGATKPQIKEFITYDERFNTGVDIQREFVFVPFSRDHNSVLRENDYIIATLEMEQSHVDRLLAFNIDLELRIGASPDFNDTAALANISLRSGLAPSVSSFLRRHATSLIPAGRELFIRVKCIGVNCT